MEGNRRSFFQKHSNPQFKRKGGSRKGNLSNSSREQSSGNPHATDTVYRILCPSRKIGSVIGKGGNIVKALREETHAKITVAESVPGSDERVIIVYSASTKVHRENESDEDQDPAGDKEDESMEPHCAAQDALLKVYDRIVEEELVGGMEDEDEGGIVVTVRLLVPNNMVGCLLGKKGDVIQRLRSDTGASIRVLPAKHLPTCAADTDELVQLSGKPAFTKRALYEVSTLLHQNPKKDKPPLNFPMPYGAQGFHPPGPPMANLPPPDPLWSGRHPNSRDIVPPMSWMEGHGNQQFDYGPGDYNGGPPMRGGEAPSEFSMKILCSAGKIGGVIGKGGFNVKQLQQETGASIHVEDASVDSEERVIRVSSFEALWDPRSQTIDAILQLQNRTSEFSEKGIITTRLLVPSSKVGCILGQGGQVINEMRRRTQADIRVYSKEDKPKCAAGDEELVQISGNFGVAKDALAEIVSRLRTRYLRDANAVVDPAPAGPLRGYGPAGSFPGGGPHPPGPIRAGSPSGYEFAKGGIREYEHSSYPVTPSATRYSSIHSAVDMRVPTNAAVGSLAGKGGSNVSEIAGTRLKLHDPHSGGVDVDIRGSSERLTAHQSILHGHAAPSGQNNPPQGSFQNYHTPQSAYPSFSAPQNPYHNTIAQQSPYQNMNSQQTPYQHFNAQPAHYHNVGAQGPYPY